MILNLTPHPIVLRDAAGADHVIAPRMGPDGKSNPARVASIPGMRVPHDGCPVPVCQATTWGALEGLPEWVAPGTLIVVSLVCAAQAAREASDLRGLAPHATQRLAVLNACVSPGQGKDVIPWTKEDAEAGLCPPTLVGLTRAVTALVRAV